MAGLCNSVFKLFECVCVSVYLCVYSEATTRCYFFPLSVSVLLRQDSHCELSILVRLAGQQTLRIHLSAPSITYVVQ